MFAIQLARDAGQLMRCYPVIAQLRPHLTQETFVAQARRQQQQCGYELLYLEDAGAVKAVAGFRITECLAWGKFLYVDDLVADEKSRSQGYGQALMEWLTRHAQAEGCDQLHLDSGVQRFGAHRFYLCQRMDITCHHFALKLK